jgi:gamma-D-glutamyl-L-lysine dipeptidyl-peptidase
MTDQVQEIINNLAPKFADGRLHVFAVHIKALQGEALALGGQVLEQTQLAVLTEAITRQWPGLQVDVSGVRILCQPGNPGLSLATNVTSVHVSPSWLAETSSHLVFGEQVEQLDESGRWVFVRQSDGYLAWVYKPFLSPELPPAATHIVLAPARELRAAPEPGAPVLTRLLCGTRVRVEAVQGEWALVTANATGWLPGVDLRALEASPQTAEARRAQMLLDARRMIGVPYLWGGTTGNGIDCSGFARLLHAWVGLRLPRDADMQHNAARPVEPPFAPGDLLFFGDSESDRRITHVGVSLGGWNMIHSSRARNGVYIDNVQEKESLRSSFVRAGTFIGA